MTTNPSHRSTSRSLPSGSFSSLWTYLLLLALLVLPLALQAQVNPEAGWTGGGGGNQNWSSAANWLTNAGYTSPLPNPFNQLVLGDGAAMVNHSSGIGTPNGAVEHVDAPWTIGVLKTTGRSFSLYGQDLTIQQATGGSTTALANGAIQIGNNNAFRTISISNNIIFDSAAYNADPLNYTHLIIMRTGPNHTIDFYGQVSKPGTNGGLSFRTTSPINIYGGLSASLTPDLTDTFNGWYNVSVAMLANDVPINFHKANNSWKYMSIDRGVVAIHTNNALPVGSQILAGNVNNRVFTIALNNWDQTLNFIEEPPGQTAAHTITTGSGVGSTLTLDDNNVTNDWSALTISGTGRLVKNGNGKLTMRNNQTYTGGTTINNGGILQLGVGITGGLLDATGSITNNGTLIINSADPFFLSGNLVGTGSLQKLAANTVSLGGITSYSGNTTIAGGTLTVGASGNLSSSPVITLSSGTTLDISATPGLTRSSGQSLSGAGSILGTVTALPGSTVTVGSSPDTLSIGNLTLDTATLNMELSGDPNTIGGGVNDLIAVGGTLTLTNVSTVYVTPLAALSTAAPYTIMQSAALSGFSSNLNVTLPYAGRYVFTVLDTLNTSNNVMVSVASTLNGNLLWRGGNPGNPTLWDVNTTTNWLNGATPDKFLANDPVAFDDSALTNQVMLGAAINSPSLVASNSSLNYTIGGAGTLTLNTLAMEGSGAFTIANTSANSLGNVTVNAGALTLANSGADTASSMTVNGGSLTVSNGAPNNLGNVAVTNGTLTIANNGPNTFSSLVAAGGTLAFNQPTNVTVSTPIVGGGAVVKNGANTLTLSANNTAFTGNMQINSGILRASATNAIGDGVVTIASGATLDLSHPNQNTLDLRSADLIVQGAGVGGQGAIVTSSAYQAFAVANMTLAGDTTIGGGWENYNGIITGAGYKLTKVDAGDYWAGSFSDTDLGDIEIQGGLLGFEFNGTTMGRPANTLTVRSNATLAFWANPGAGTKSIVMDNGGSLKAGSGASTFGGSMVLNGTNRVTFYGTTANLTFNGTMSGPGALSVDSVGTMVLASENIHTGGTYVTNGFLRLTHPLALSSNLMVVIKTNGLNGAGQVFGNNVPRVELSDGVVIPPGVTIVMNSDGAMGCRTSFGVGTATTGNEFQGTIIPNGDGYIPLNVLANAGLTISGQITNLNWAGTLGFRSSSLATFGTANCTISGPIRFNGELQANSAAPYTITSTGNQWQLTGIYGPGYVKLGANDCMCITAPVYMEAATGGWDLNGFNQTIPSITAVGTAGVIGNSSTTTDSLLTINGGTNSFITNSIVDSVNGGTMKVALTITNTHVRIFSSHTYTGPTLVKNGATLSGAATLASPVTVESGGTIVPGASIGVMTINNSLTLSNGSTTVMEVTALGSNDGFLGLTSVTYGGTLVITNIGVPPLAAGNSFPLFQASSYNGSFSSIVPATPGPGLAWNTNNLNVNGTLSVVATAPPNVDSVTKLPDGNIQLTLSGPTGSGYTVRASTNVALPLASWTVITTNTITTSPFNFSDLNATNFTQRFYRMSVP